MKKSVKAISFALCVAMIVSVCFLGLVGCDLFSSNDERIEVESVEITCNNSFKVTSALALNAMISPSDASDSNLTYTINESVTTAHGARIVNDVLYADSEGVIGITAKAANGVQSPMFMVSVVKEPVTSVINTNDNRIRYSEFQQFDSAYSLSETGWNTSGNVKFLTNDQNARSGRGMVSLEAQNAGIYRIFELNPFESVSIKFYTSNRSIESYKSYYIVKILEDGVWRNYGDTLSCNVGDWKECKPVEYRNDSSIKKEVTIGFFRTNGNSIFVNPIVFIDDMTVNISTRYPFMRSGTQLALTCSVLPLNATYRDVTYQIISSETTASGARIENGILYAQSAGIVKIYPIADGVYGEPFTIEVI